MGRIILAAAGSGSGKTVITCGLCRCMVNKKISVKAYKCGPDYIDPMFHREVLGVPSQNLDTFFSDEKHIWELLSAGESYELSIIEGVMGIYDGLGGCSIEGSAYDLAVKTSSPIILIFNAHGMGRTMVSQLKGIIQDDSAKLIKGIIINQISETFYDTVAPIIEKEMGVRVLGSLGKLKGIHIESRHLGLMLPSEIHDLQMQVDRLAEEMEKKVDLEKILEIAGKAGKCEVSEAGKYEVSEAGKTSISCKAYEVCEAREVCKAYESCEARESGKEPSMLTRSMQDKEKVKLAVAKDAYFCFYYDENFRMLERQGCELVFFSPLHDKELPEDISGIYIGGGYPELGLKELEANVSMRRSIREAIAGNIPVIAECGGFMYLHEKISDADGNQYQMVGSIEGECYHTAKLVRFGYVNILAGDIAIKGHEFHYFDSTAKLADCHATKPTTAKLTDCHATKPTTGKQWDFGYYRDGSYMGFPHLYFPSGKEFVIDFVDHMRTYNAV